MNVLNFIMLFFAILFVSIIIIEVYKKHKKLQIQVDRLENAFKKNAMGQTACNILGVQNSTITSYRCCNPNKCVTHTPMSLKIYHIMVDRFAGWTIVPNNNYNAFVGGTLRGIIENLDYIQKMGYNTIMLTPIHKGAAYHGYHTTDYTEIDEHFGNWSDFRELIRQVHNRGMKIICDFVLNHCHSFNHLFQSAMSHRDNVTRDWFYIYDNGTYESFQDYPNLPKFNLYNDCAVAHLINQVRILAWLGVDGLRIDHAIGVPFHVLKRLTQDIKINKPDFFFIGEVWGAGIRRWDQVEFLNEQRRKEAYSGTLSQDTHQKDYVGVLDGVLDFAFRDIVLESVRIARRNGTNLDMDGLRAQIHSHIDSYHEDFMLVPFLDNHDTNRIMFECGNNRILVDQLLELMREMCSSYSVYYGTEDYMTHERPIGEEAYSDCNVRRPKEW